MHLPFDDVREALLRAGIAPRHVRRYIAELRDHLFDRTTHERNAGYGAEEAAARARAFLGTDAELAQALIDKGEFRSLAARAPWAVFAIVPLLLVFAIGAVLVFLMFTLLAPYFGPGSAADPTALPESLRAFVKFIAFSSRYMLGPLMAALCIAMALRQRMHVGWPLFGLLLIGLVCGIFALNAPVDVGDKGPFNATPHVGNQVDVVTIALRFVVLFVASSAIYLALRRRLMAIHAG